MKYVLSTIVALFGLVLFPATSNALTCPDLDGAYVFSQEYDPTYLGFFGSQYASESIMNRYGTYGSEFNSLSVRNPYGTYGSEFNLLSATNPYTSTPPAIYKYGVQIGYLTANSVIANGVSLGAIDASCTFYSSVPAVEANPVYPPAPPSQVSASDGTDSEVINISWSAVSDATGYSLYFSESKDSELTYINTYTNRSVGITGAEPGKTYYFWVYSINSAGISSTGTYDTGYLAQASTETVPEPPSITGSEVGDGKVTLKFRSNGNGGTPIAGYTATCGASSKSGTSSPITVVGLSNGTTYECNVVATNAVGDSNPSNTTTVAPQAPAISFSINAGLNDAWYNPTTSGQGVLISVLADTGIVFAAWFTFDSERPNGDAEAIVGGPGQRWLTAQGGFSGNSATLDVYSTTGGVLNKTKPGPASVPVGWMEITWENCATATVEYSIETDSGVQAGSIDLIRIANDNVALCEALSE